MVILLNDIYIEINIFILKAIDSRTSKTYEANQYEHTGDPLYHNEIQMLYISHSCLVIFSLLIVYFATRKREK